MSTASNTFSITHIKKRDGRIVPFDLVKIVSAIAKAFDATYKPGSEAIAQKLAEEVLHELDVVTPSVSFPVRRLSGGNVQKVLVGREIAQAPSVLMTAYAVRGLDINTSYTIYNLLTEQKMKGVAVVYVGEDLDVLVELCDRILILCSGYVNGIVDGTAITKEEIGLMMTHLNQKGESDEQ